MKLFIALLALCFVPLSAQAETVLKIGDQKGNAWAVLIATGRGSIGHQLILAELEKEGLTASDVQIVFLLPADAGPALLQGSVDAWATWDPYVAQLELLKGARIVADGTGITPGLGYFIARREALDDQAKREALRDLSGRIAKARRWGSANFRDYAVVWSKIVGLPSEVGLKMLERQNARPVLIDQSVISDEQKTIELYLRSGLISNHVDAASVIDPIFNDAVIRAGATN